MRYDWTPLWRSSLRFDRPFDVFEEAQRAREGRASPQNAEQPGCNRPRISGLPGLESNRCTANAITIAINAPEIAHRIEARTARRVG